MAPLAEPQPMSESISQVHYPNLTDESLRDLKEHRCPNNFKTSGVRLETFLFDEHLDSSSPAPRGALPGRRGRAGATGDLAPPPARSRGGGASLWDREGTSGKVVDPQPSPPPLRLTRRPPGAQLPRADADGEARANRWVPAGPGCGVGEGDREANQALGSPPLGPAPQPRPPRLRQPPVLPWRRGAWPTAPPTAAPPTASPPRAPRGRGQMRGPAASADAELSAQLSRRLDINEGAARPRRRSRVFNPYTEFPEFSRRLIKDLESVFKRYDAGRDGFIDLMELKLMMEKLGAPQTHLGLKSMIKEVDEDFDGKLSFREFLLIFHKAAAGELREDSGLLALAKLSEINVALEGVKGAKDFFEAKAQALSSSSKFEAELKAEQEERKREEEERRLRRAAFKELKAAFST
ncbi:PREDICTED: EF-hand domain-containing protein D1 [Dipodomys ordii]|uniref:EF-hand domain-containing protein D1 n=1 Tax=Dipodomys ordii TaxID=10020 RepID=A0A1S3FP23_DIPOR|nr:PREDICTED: EF-hand domain-containing protein D1 [Dipodomys ordii]